MAFFGNNRGASGGSFFGGSGNSGSGNSGSGGGFFQKASDDYGRSGKDYNRGSQNQSFFGGNGSGSGNYGGSGSGNYGGSGNNYGGSYRSSLIILKETMEVVKPLKLMGLSSVSSDRNTRRWETNHLIQGVSFVCQSTKIFL